MLLQEDGKKTPLINFELDEVGKDLFQLIERLYPICRSITGDGVRKTLDIIKEHVPLKICDVPTGTKVFDWTVPKEWNITDGWIKDSTGKKIVDFKKSNLHVLNYSIPVNKKISLSELKKHLYTLPEHPNWIPYLTSYYKDNWGFCLSHNQYENLQEDTYEVFIDSSLKSGSLTYGELFLEGKAKKEILFTCYLCHPSLCNDSLSGVSLVTFLAKKLLTLDLRYSYRFLFIPETIGAITWLSLNEDKVKNISCGLVATCLGDRGIATYKKTKNGNSIIDKIVEKVLFDSKKQYKIIDFFPLGSDERQFSSPGFNLNIGSLMRTIYAQFPEYHTSADNLDFMDVESLYDSFNNYLKSVFILENNNTYVSLNPKCEPQLGKRGLYSMIGGGKNSDEIRKAMLWILNFSDGTNSLLDISIKSRINFEQVRLAADMLLKCSLLKVC